MAIPSTIVEHARAHPAAGIAKLSIMLLAGAAAAVWRASQRAEPELDARTRARLTPRTPSATGAKEG